jgi:hypothetical protein
MSPIEQAQANVDQLRKAVAAVNTPLSAFKDQQAKLEQERARLQAQHNSDCRGAAAGDGVDPSLSKSALDMVEAKLRGTASFVDELTQKSLPLSTALAKAELTLLHRQHLDVLQALLVQETESKAAGLAAVEAGAAKMREHGQVVFKIGAERKRGEAIEKQLREASNG